MQEKNVKSLKTINEVIQSFFTKKTNVIKIKYKKNISKGPHKSGNLYLLT